MSGEKERAVHGGSMTAGIALVLLFVTTFMLRMTGNMVQTTIPLFGQDYLQMGSAEVGIASGVFMLAGVLSPLLIVSRMRVDKMTLALVMFSALFAATVPLYYFAASLVSFYVLIVLTAVASSTVMLLMLTSSQTLRPGSEHRTIGIYTVALSSSLVFGPFLEGIVAGNYDSLRPVFLAFFPFVLSSVILLAVRHHKDAPAQPAERDGLTGGSSVSALPSLRAARGLFRSKSFMLPTLSQMSYSIVFASILSFGGILAVQRISAGYSEVFYLFGTFFGTSWVTRVTLTAGRNPTKKTNLLQFSMLLSIAGMVLVRFSDVPATMFLSFAILGIPHGLQYPVSAMMIAEGIQRERLPVANALFSSTGAVPFALTPIAVGYLATYVGLAPSFLLMALPVALLWAVFHMVEKSFTGSATAAEGE